MRQIALFLCTLVYPFFVILLFRSQIFQHPAQIALIGFIVIAVSNVYFGFNAQWKFQSAVFWGALVFIFASALPISIMNITAIFHSEPFATQTFLGIPANTWHDKASHMYSLMIIGHIIDYARHKLSR